MSSSSTLAGFGDYAVLQKRFAGYVCYSLVVHGRVRGEVWELEKLEGRWSMVDGRWL
jgi:hypothetical protein